jgi:hypothetical protein
LGVVRNFAAEGQTGIHPAAAVSAVEMFEQPTSIAEALDERQKASVWRENH